MLQEKVQKYSRSTDNRSRCFIGITAEFLSTNEFFTTGGISLLPGQIILYEQIGS